MDKQLSRRRILASAGALALATQMKSHAAPQPGAPSAVLDTDTYNGIDDQFAIAYAMLSPDAMTVEAIYAAPFVNRLAANAGEGMEKSYEEIQRVLEHLGRTGSVPVHKGASRFMKDAGGGAVRSAAATDLIDRAMKSDRSGGRLYVLSIGAPTNVVSAIALEPQIKKKICVVWLGGQPYDAPSAREFNLEQDLAASQALYNCGVELVNIPTTDVSDKLRVTRSEVETALKGKSSIADYLCQTFVDFTGHHPAEGGPPDSKIIWDISAVAWLVNPGWVPTTMLPSPILRKDLTWGPTDDSRAGVRVATDIDRDAIYNDLFTKLAAG